MREPVALSLSLVLLLPLGLAGAGEGPAPSATPPPLPAPGDLLPPFDAEALDGAVKHVAYPKGSKTVLLFLSSSCPVCHRMIPRWNRAYDRRPQGLEVVGVLMDKEPPGFFVAMPISFPVLRSPGAAFRQTFKVNRVPLTVRVGPGGKVEDVGVGQIDPIRLGELFHP